VHDTRRTRLVLGVLLVVAIGLITLDYRGFGPVGSLRGASAGFFGPVERVTADVTRPVTGFFAAIVGAPAAHSRIQALEQENLRLRAELNTAQLSKADAAQLSRLLQVAGRGGYRLVAAHVIGIGVGFEDTVTIDAGTRDGIRADQTVLNQAGLVGRVIQAGQDTSTVLLATDASSAVGCRLEGSQEIGVVRGTGKSLSAQGGLRIELLDANAVLQPGQRIVTLGSVGGHPYVPGVPIGVITRVEATPGALTRTAIVRPFVQFTALDIVGVVVVPPRHNPRDSVLPPRPSPSASPTASPTSSPNTSVSGSPAPSPSAGTPVAG
jgi:rod shape-determining protein MreC